MAIQFVVENGTFKSDATSYVSVEEFTQYWENFGTDYSAKTDAQVQVKLNEASMYIDNLYTWQGYKSTETQGLQFPRDRVYDRNNYDLSGEVPDAIKNAVNEIAGWAMEGNSLDEPVGNIQSRSMGPMSVSYTAGGQMPKRILRAIKYVGDLSKGLTVTR